MRASWKDAMWESRSRQKKFPQIEKEIEIHLFLVHTFGTTTPCAWSDAVRPGSDEDSDEGLED